MSTSWSCEQELRKMAEELHGQAYELEQAADLLQLMRDTESQESTMAKIKSLKLWAAGWIKRG